MIRRYHRWLSLILGIFLVYIAATGVMSHVAELVANGGFEKEEAAKPAPAASVPAAPAAIIPAAPPPSAAPAASATATAFTCPADMTCRPRAKPTGARAWVGWLHRIHSGTEFGPVGVILSMLSGLALLFFALSGLWMYYELYRGRLARPARNGDTSRFFWK